MAKAEYLADTSALSRLDRSPVAEALGPLVRGGQVAICAPVEFELRFSAANLDEYRSLIEELVSMPSVPVGERTCRRALSIQTSLAEAGRHRAVSLVDLLVAAAAERAGLTLLHYDGDFELIAAVTGQPTRWVVPRGTAD